MSRSLNGVDDSECIPEGLAPTDQRNTRAPRPTQPAKPADQTKSTRVTARATGVMRKTS
jgi:hypothetical protein